MIANTTRLKVWEPPCRVALGLRRRLTLRVFGWDARKFSSLVLIAAILALALFPTSIRSQSLPELGLKNGPFVDKIQFKVIPGDDQQVLALLNDEIDLIGSMIHPSFLSQLNMSESVNVVNHLRNGYGYIVINCAKYPFNITAFRRAAAFALDKYAISEDIWEGFSQPQDSCVPSVNPFSIEGQLSYSYYDANIELGNQLLDDAGFLDVDADGFRDAPDGSNLDVLLQVGRASNIGIEVGEKMAEGLRALNISAVSEPIDFPVYGSWDFDMIFLGMRFNSFDVDWLAYEFWGGHAGEPWQNFGSWRNASYDGWRDQLINSTSYEDVYEAAIEMQRVWVYECPWVICYENFHISAYRTDRFEGHVNDWTDGIPGTWTNKKVHLKADQGGPFGGTLRWSNSLDLDTFNMMGASSAYTLRVLIELYDSLMTLDSTGLDMMWLAESYLAETHADNAAIPAGHTRFTFQLLQNATWTDGTSLTAEDVAFSLNFLRDAPANKYRLDLLEMSAAYAPSTYTVVVEFSTESYWHLHGIAFKPIFPKHIMQEIVIEDWAYWSPNPPVEEMVTSGPFNVSEYVAGEFVELTYNPNYFFGPNRSAGIESTPTAPTSNGTPSVTSFGWPDPFGEMDLVGRVVTTGSLFVIAVVAVLWWKDTRM